VRRVAAGFGVREWLAGCEGAAGAAGGQQGRGEEGGLAVGWSLEAQARQSNSSPKFRR
jgi:hypothetical protein